MPSEAPGNDRTVRGDSSEAGGGRCEKRGGIRVIYKYRNEKFPLFLLTVYAKNQKANLTKAERNAWNNLVPVLVATYAKKRPI